MELLCPNRVEDEIQRLAQTFPIRVRCVMPIKQRVLRKANDDARYVCSVARRSTQIEFAIPNALLQEAS